MSSLDHWSSWTNFDTRTQNRSNSEDFVAKVERCVYENEKLSDDEVENECRFWAQRFPHLRIVGKGISSKCEQKDLETLRMSIARKLVKNYLWNSVVEVIEAEVRKCSTRGSVTTQSKDKKTTPRVELATKLPSIVAKKRSSSVRKDK
ncbi:hypothetical protein Tcan_13198 [Toxocara canis]|uniref:DUF3719 domain-containing protein n=1 Tax=Toxocara canis TaxID=6265 RepID=A0A0B2VDW6_TOXCA|nr:hypothetical protein Tcan_13198 [Toxocara canis]